MADPTESVRRAMVRTLNSQVESSDEDLERKRLEAEWGQVWNAEEVQEDFGVLAFLAPLVTGREKATGKRGTLMFQHHPRFYFEFREE